MIHNGIQFPHHVSYTRGNRFVGQFGWPADAIVVGITGQMTATKGHEEVIRAVADLASKYPKLHLVVGGKPLEPYFHHLTQIVKELNLCDRISFSGWLSDVTDFFNQIDLFVLASRHEEGYGLVVAEAMACGKPVIATASGGVIEIVEDQVTGFIVPRQDVTALSSKIRLLLHDASLRQFMGEAGRDRISKHFNMTQKAVEFKNYLVECSQQ